MSFLIPFYWTILSSYFPLRDSYYSKGIHIVWLIWKAFRYYGRDNRHGHPGQMNTAIKEITVEASATNIHALNSSAWEVKRKRCCVVLSELKGGAPKHHSWVSWGCCSWLNFRATRGKWCVSRPQTRPRVQPLCLRPAPVRLLNKGLFVPSSFTDTISAAKFGTLYRTGTQGWAPVERGVQLWTAISSSISETKKTPKSFCLNPKSERS